MDQPQSSTRNRPSNAPNSSESVSLPPLTLLGIGAAILVALFHAKLSLLSKVGTVQRYGFHDVEVSDAKAWITMRDNAYEDGDRVTLKVNNRVYVSATRLSSAGRAVPIDLNSGPNLVQIYGDRDGGGGITLAADVAGIGNITDTPFPERATAGFYIIRR